MKKIYLDYSAAAPLDKRVLKAMLPYFCDKFGNPSSIHSFGQEAIAGVDKAREQVSRFLNCEPDEIIFTSGATESDNLAIKGVIKAIQKSPNPPSASSGQALYQGGIKNLHIITSSIEHPAVLEPCRELEKEGVEAAYLPVKTNGVIDAGELKKAIKENTALVSIMYANSEVGSVQPIREIGKIISKINEKKLKDWKNAKPAVRGNKPRPIYFHVDATQAVNFLNCDTRWNYIDLLSMSGHKIYGPKGAGALYVKTGIPIEPLQLGGHQENGLRSGTYNVPGIVGLGRAIELLELNKTKKPPCAEALEDKQKNNKTTAQKSIQPRNKKIEKLRDRLVSGVMKNIPDVILNTDRENAVPSHANFSFLGVEGESILISLDLEGIAVSTGSACASGKLEPSYVLLAMGIKPEVAHSSIRFSLGKFTTEQEIKKAIKILPPIIKKLRKMSPM